MDNLLDMDLGSFDTSFPLIAEGIHDLQIETAEVVPTAAGDGETLKLTLKTINPVNSSKGEELAPGQKVFHRIMLTPKGEMKPESIQRQMAQFIQSVGVTGFTMGNVKQRATELNGQMLRAKVTIDPERTKGSKTYPTSNAIGLFMKKGQ